MPSAQYHHLTRRNPVSVELVEQSSPEIVEAMARYQASDDKPKF